MANSKHIKYKADGTPYYSYYKKKLGRPKKRGPKSKKYIPVKERNYQKWDFKILRFDFKKQVEYIGQYHDYGEVTEKMNSLLEENKKIEIPVKFINNKRKNPSHYEYEGEYVVLKRIRDKNTQTNESMLRDEYGRFVKHITTSENWFIYEKFPYYKEETFWVYGYNPKTGRKTIKWIYSNFISNFIENTYDIVQVYLYNNKLIFRYPENKLNFIITKNVSDGIRVYNFLQDKYKKNKQVIFTGFITKHSDRAMETISLLKEKTGWDITKIYRRHT